MAFKVINKINGRVKFLYRKNRYLTPFLKRLFVIIWFNNILIMFAQLGIQIWIRNSKENCKLSKANALVTVSS